MDYACFNGEKEIAIALMDRGADMHMKTNVRINNTFIWRFVLYTFYM
jgi:hypothetical protein